jgi:hypothetical protein
VSMIPGTNLSNVDGGGDDSRSRSRLRNRERDESCRTGERGLPGEMGDLGWACGPSPPRDGEGEGIV